MKCKHAFTPAYNQTQKGIPQKKQQGTVSVHGDKICEHTRPYTVCWIKTIN